MTNMKIGLFLTLLILFVQADDIVNYGQISRQGQLAGPSIIGGKNFNLQAIHSIISPSSQQTRPSGCSCGHCQSKVNTQSIIGNSGKAQKCRGGSCKCKSCWHTKQISQGQVCQDCAKNGYKCHSCLAKSLVKKDGQSCDRCRNGQCKCENCNCGNCAQQKQDGQSCDRCRNGQCKCENGQSCDRCRNGQSCERCPNGQCKCENGQSCDRCRNGQSCERCPNGQCKCENGQSCDRCRNGQSCERCPNGQCKCEIDHQLSQSCNQAQNAKHPIQLNFLASN